jgi:hypothetical protein
MKPAFRRDLARLPFEEKIRKVAELIWLSRKVKVQRASERTLVPMHNRPSGTKSG